MHQADTKKADEKLRKYAEQKIAPFDDIYEYQQRRKKYLEDKYQSKFVTALAKNKCKTTDSVFIKKVCEFLDLELEERRTRYVEAKFTINDGFSEEFYLLYRIEMYGSMAWYDITRVYGNAVDSESINYLEPRADFLLLKFAKKIDKILPRNATVILGNKDEFGRYQ